MQHSICQQIGKTQQWPQNQKRSVFIPIPKQGSTKELPYDPAIPLLGIYLKKIKTPIQKDICTLMFRAGASQVVLGVKNSSANAGRLKRCRFNPWVGKIPWRRAQQSTPVFLPGESMDRGAWWATVHRVARSQTWGKRPSTYICTISSLFFICWWTLRLLSYSGKCK